MIKENVSRIRQRILKVCSKINQDPEKITIIAVSKGKVLEQIKEAIDAGINNIGENRVQEAAVKYNVLRTMNYKLRTHMVGHLQTNKVKDAVRIFDLIQSVDSLRLAEEIDKQADKINKIQDILIEIKTSPEESKFGLKADEAIEVITELTKFKNINIKGLMTIAPIVDNPEETRPCFKILRELRDRINELRVPATKICATNIGASANSYGGGGSATNFGGTRYELEALSMGMTDDFEIAIEEGSNMVRLGRAIFEV